MKAYVKCRRKIESIAETHYTFMTRNFPEVVGTVNWKQRFQACLHRCFCTKKFHWKSKERKKQVVQQLCDPYTTTDFKPSKEKQFLGNGERNVTISHSLAWIDCIKTFPFRFTTSVILFGNSLFCNSLSEGEEEGRPLFLLSPSKLQPWVPAHYGVTWVCIVVSSTGQQGLVPASLSKEENDVHCYGTDRRWCF